MKAIILTSAPINNEERELLKNTEVYKLAINGLAEELNPTERICTDYGVIVDLLNHHPQKLITTRDWVPNERLIYAGHISFKGSTLVSAVEYLVSEGYKDILIVGDNTVHDKFFQDRIKHETKRIYQENHDVNLYHYSKNGNFEFPYMSISYFLEK